MDHLNKIFSKHIDDGKFPGVQWQINIKDKIWDFQSEEIIKYIEVSN